MAFKNIQLYIAFVLFLCPFIANGSHGQTPPVSVALENKSVTLGEPVLLRIAVKNQASEPLELDLGADGKDNILISVVDPKGDLTRKPQSQRREGMTFFGWMRLEPGEERLETLVLNEWFEFKQIGKYRIEIQLKQSATIAKQTLSIGVFSLTLDVTAYDHDQLDSICRSLASKIRQRDTADEMLAAGVAERALSYVHDPVVVPYWDQVLEYSPESAISSLYKIGNIDAVGVIARALHLRSKEVRVQARRTLQALGRDTADPLLKARVEAVLGQPH